MGSDSVPNSTVSTIHDLTTQQKAEEYDRLMDLIRIEVSKSEVQKKVQLLT